MNDFCPMTDQQLIDRLAGLITPPVNPKPHRGLRDYDCHMPTPAAYELPAIEDRLLAFPANVLPMGFIMVPMDPTFALPFTSEDYNLYAGPRDFVECVLGASQCICQRPLVARSTAGFAPALRNSTGHKPSSPPTVALGAYPD